MPKKKTQRKRRRKSTPPRHKPFVPSPEPRVSADEVVLKPGKGSS